MMQKNIALIVVQEWTVNRKNKIEEMIKWKRKEIMLLGVVIRLRT